MSSNKTKRVVYMNGQTEAYDQPFVLQQEPQAFQFFSTPKSVVHEIYLYQDIVDANAYVPVIQALDAATENEEFHIHVSTNGGDLEGCIALIHAIRRTQAVVVGFSDGVVASAGTIIFLSCPNLVINEFSYFMFHDGSTMTFGKFNESKKQLDAIMGLYRSLAEKIYKPFLTDSEINAIMDGSDLYQTSEQMLERVNRVISSQKETDEEEPEPELLTE